MGLAAVSNSLRRERNALEQLAFKLSEEQRLLEVGDVWALALATREVATTLEEVGQADLMRAIEVQLVVEDLGLDSTASMRQIVDASPSPWSTILRSHYEALRALTNEITRLARVNGRQHARAAVILETISSIRLDTAEHQCAPTALFPSLVDFLK